MPTTRRISWLFVYIVCFHFFCIFTRISANKYTASSDMMMSNESSQNNSSFITISIDKLLISRPPTQCCTREKLSSCEICTYTCKFHVYDSNNPRCVFIDHTFNCSIEMTGKKIRIPLLNQLSAPKIEVQLGIFTKSNDQLVSGLTPLYVENLEHEPESRILKMNIEDRYDINFNVSLTCVDGFVGPYCNISCVPPKIGEHHLCSPAGRFCELGYMGENCTVPICTYGCVQGTCMGPNICKCEPGWYGKRCEHCLPSKECRNPFYDNQTKKCRCVSFGIKGATSENLLSEELSRLDREYNKQMKANNTTYMTLFIFMIVLLMMVISLLIVIIVIALRGLNLNWPCASLVKNRWKPQRTATVPSLIDV